MKIIDLTRVIQEGMAQHPAHGKSPVFLSGTRSHDFWKRLEYPNPYDPDDCVSFQNEQIIVCGHTGTHMDSCFHADPESGYTIDRMPLECGFGNAIWLDVSHKFKPKGQISAKDLQEAEFRSGASILPNDIVLIHTGWSSVTDPAEYSTHFMGLAKDAGEWLREKKVRTVGIDSCNLDAHDMAHPVHMNFLRPRSLGLDNSDFIAIIENLVHIDQIPKARFLFSGAPIPYLGATGGQIRAMAIIES
ncbi:cyclase family protein [Effusibacillus dendaii]|uniref:Cyclase n=1 Tax=Effusibacillus dendaii TaxID=2743772 RepID=A0A7I8D800_9BACL|nr:cyclase family protein [Effusibacillus dendaii]BCJ85502.1 cyclase [Effusibacillus dendaii]